MMKRVMAYISVVAALVVVATGCGGAHRYDARLVAADSLMWDAPDSALAVLGAIDSLGGEANRAYRDLLMTQARYKCYQEITALDNSAISHAITYYRAHSGDREKLTRATLYKGAVMEELGHVDSAMYYYKTAEATADPKDYFTLGYVNMRMGALYRDHYSMDGKDIEKYELADKYLKMADDKYYQLRCKINLGSLYKLYKPNEAEITLNEAISLAQELNDTSAMITCIECLIIMYDHYDNLQKAREQVKHIISFPRNRLSNLSLTSSAKVYAQLGIIDSAYYFLDLSQSTNITDPIDQLSYMECMGAIALAKGDTLKHLQYDQQCKLLSDSLKAIQHTITILNSEHDFDQFAKNAIQRHHKRTFSWLVDVSVLAILILSFIYYRRFHRYDKIIDSIKQQSASHLNDLTLLRQNIENH